MKAKIFFPLLLVLILGLFPVETGLYGAGQCIGDAVFCPMDLTQLDAFRYVLKMQPWRVELWQQAGMTAYEQEDWTAAQKLFSTAEENNALDQQGQQMLAQAHLNSGNIDVGIEQMLALMENRELLLKDFRELFDLLMADFRITEAEQVAAVWMEEESDNADAFLSLGLVQLSRDHNAALNNFKLASTLETSLQPFVRDIDLAITQAHLSEDAAYQQLFIGRELANQGYPIYAEVLCAQAVKINPQYAEAWAMLGEMQQQNGRSDGFAALETAVQLDPESTLVQSLMAIYWQRKGDPSQAVAYYEQLIVQHPEEFRWQVALAKATADNGDIPAGYEIMLVVAEDFPDETQVWIETANFCSAYGMDVATVGLNAAREALRRDPDDPAAMTTMGNVLFALSDFDSAQRYYQRAVDEEPQNAHLHFLLGKIYLAKENPSLAMYHLELALTLAPGYSTLAMQIERAIEALR